jgi:hypothetical protein
MHPVHECVDVLDAALPSQAVAALARNHKATALVRRFS